MTNYGIKGVMIGAANNNAAHKSTAYKSVIYKCATHKSAIYSASVVSKCLDTARRGGLKKRCFLIR